MDIEALKIFLIDSRLTSKKDFELAQSEAETSGGRVEDLLISKGFLTEDDLRRAKSYVLGIPFVDLKREHIPRDVLALIPEPLARKHNLVAYKKTGDTLEIAMLDPLDLEAIDFIKKSSKLKILPRLTDTESMKNVLVQYQKSLKAEFGDIIQKESLNIKNSLPAEDLVKDGEEVSMSDLQKMAEDLPVVRVVESLLSHAIMQKASDIHIEPFEKELVIRYRLDGVLHDAMILPRETASGIVARIKVLCNMRLDEKRLPQDGRFKIDTNGQNVSFRVSTLPTQFGEKVVMRLLPDSVHGYTLEAVGFHGEGLEKVQKAIQRTTGLVLVTGPTGSGKSTTLYALLDILNTPDVNISTIEDPIEYQISRINQTQVRPDIGLTFATGLRTLVRQDPDIIMVGEIRDKETSSLAINASLTGHLVLSTLHTNSAAGTIPRLLDLGAEPFLLVSTLEVIVAQRLVRRLCAEKEAYIPTEIEIKSLASKANLTRVLEYLKKEKIVKETDDWKTINFYKPKVAEANSTQTVCPEGYSGRVSINEVLPMSRAMHELVLKGSSAEALAEQARSEGMLTMFEDGIFKVVQGITTIEEVLRAVTE
jgi:type IV pilus assembly protein PilB